VCQRDSIRIRSGAPQDDTLFVEKVTRHLDAAFDFQQFPFLLRRRSYCPRWFREVRHYGSSILYGLRLKEKVSATSSLFALMPPTPPTQKCQMSPKVIICSYGISSYAMYLVAV
jgi:hypothetical protein